MEFNKEETFNDRPRHEHGPHHHRPHFGKRPLPLSEEMIDCADVQTLFRICAHDMRMADSAFGMSQDAILKALSRDEELSQKDLQHRLHVRPGSISEIISKMEEKGLLIRERDEEDRRHAILHITEEGRKAAASIKEPEPFFKHLNEEELEALKGLLKKVVKARHLQQF